MLYINSFLNGCGGPSSSEVNKTKKPSIKPPGGKWGDTKSTINVSAGEKVVGKFYTDIENCTWSIEGSDYFTIATVEGSEWSDLLIRGSATLSFKDKANKQFSPYSVNINVTNPNAAAGDNVFVHYAVVNVVD